MDKRTAVTQLPVDRINAAITILRDSGRDMDQADWSQAWQGEQYGLRLTWADGFVSFVGFGEAGTAIVESLDAARH